MYEQYRKGQFGLYAYRNRVVWKKWVLAFLVGFIVGVFVVIYALRYI